MEKHYSVSKEENEECEDALEYYLAEESEGFEHFLKIAIADGASSSAMASQWANILVKAFINQQIYNEQELLTSIEISSNKINYPRGKLSWYAETKLQQGAFSTLLGITFSKSSDETKGMWQAIAVGDSCFFHCTENNLIRAFPINKSKDFNNRPNLIASNSDYNGNFSEKVKRSNGEWEKGEFFILATDALAKWFLIQLEKEPSSKPWKILAGFETEQTFKNWIQEKKENLELDDDDISFLIWSFE